MGAAAIIARIFSQLQKLLNVQMPCLQVGANRSLAFAALVDCNGSVVDNLEEGDNTLGLSIGSLDVGTKRAHRCPVVAKTACKFREQGVLLDGVVYAAEIVRHRGQVARRQLRAQRARIEKGWCARHEVE